MSKYFTRTQLLDACKVADLTKRNRRIAWEMLPEDVQYFPVTFSMVHNDVEMRVRIMFDESGAEAYLDIPFNTYEELGSLEELEASMSQGGESDAFRYTGELTTHHASN